ncbi:hypothetical protein [Enterobacter soli]|uniref:hypothetical protein n=1 Tax=Enterobacter soli TaxID=885040 RepID=UPI002F3E38F5
METPENIKKEFFKFLQLFIFLFSSFFVFVNQQSLQMSSAGNVEQWLNLMPEFFSNSQDFLFSYGPLYWLTGKTVVQYSEFTYWLTITFISFFSAIHWSILLRLALKRNAIIILAIVIFTGMTSINSPTTYFILPLLMVVYIHSLGWVQWINNKLVLLTIAAFVAFLFYVRFFYGMVALLTFGSYIFSSQIPKREYSSLIIITLATIIFYCTFGFFIFTNSDNILNYTIINSQLNFGNSVDMTKDVDVSIFAYIIISIIFILFNTFLIKTNPIFILTINGLLVIFLKIGFSRADHYIDYFIGPVAIMSMLFSISRNKLWILLSTFVLGLLFLLGNLSIYPGVLKLPTLRIHADFSKSVSDRAAERYQQYKIPNNVITMIGQQSIDVYPYLNEYMIANKLNYRHRPSFQNYMTLTPKLDKLNAEFFEGAQAPEFVLWTGGIGCLREDCEAFDDFDGKYMLNEDPITTTSILSHYKPVNTFTDMNKRPMVLMQKIPHSEMIKPQYLGKITLHLGEWVQVPNLSSSAVKLVPQLNLTLIAKIQNMLYRGEILYIHYKFSSGEIKRYRLNIINTQSGIWISPLLNELPLKGPRVVEIMLSTPSKHYFVDNFEANWVGYPFDGLDIKEPNRQIFSGKLPTDYPLTTGPCSASIDSVGSQQMKIDGQIQTTLKSIGWAAHSVVHDMPADQVWLTLTNASGQRYYAPVDKMERPDVAEHYKKINLVHSGYKIVADISRFKGHYQVGLLIASEGKMQQCSNIIKPLILQ